MCGIYTVCFQLVRRARATPSASTTRARRDACTAPSATATMNPTVSASAATKRDTERTRYNDIAGTLLYLHLHISTVIACTDVLGL